MSSIDAVHWGASYYPELIPEAEWVSDLDNMVAAGVTVIRMLDFAWTALEPEEGVYTWDWLDRFLALCQERSIGTIMCTPTATPPAWLTRQYPEIMIVDDKGQTRPWGNRREADVDSPIFRHFSVNIARRMGERYGQHPVVLGWQLDNELLGSELMPPECHSRASQFRFRDWLKNHYATVQDVNATWGMRFWNQEFTRWGEIDTPHHGRPCLGHYLDYARYFSESQRDYMQLQTDALREVVNPEQWIAHNSTAVFDRGLDHRVYGQALDVVGWDAYFGAAAGRAGCHHAAFSALANDLFRSCKQRPFWVFETNPFVASTPDCYYAEMVARGAAGVVVWHWRTHRAHVEQGSQTMTDLAGRPHEERVARQVALKEHPDLATIPADASQARKVAFVFSSDEVRAEIQPNPYRRDPSAHYLKAVGAMYQAAWNLGLPCDVVAPGEPLDGYDLVIAPALSLMDEAQAAVFTDYVAKGGVLAACGPTAHKDLSGVFHPNIGGPLVDLLGFSQRRPAGGAPEQTIRWNDGGSASVTARYDEIASTDGEVLARFDGGKNDGGVAAFRRQHGTGSLCYLAACGEELAPRFLRHAAESAGLPVLDHGHADVGTMASGDSWWLFNYAKEARTVGGVELAPGGWAKVKASELPITQ
ncbi:MAG: beta-galactosidase [Planctomycetota bacterium]|jgi:beta-galactosidase|nr:beta-galactosidase [Planctomycetota bacterium]